VRRGKFYTALFFAGVLLGLVVVCIGRADAADPQHDYHVSWDLNDPTERVNRYTISAISDTGNSYVDQTIGDPPANELTIPISEPVGTVLQFNAIACRDEETGTQAESSECSDPSAPIPIVHPPADLTPPSGVQVIRVTVEVIR